MNDELDDSDRADLRRESLIESRGGGNCKWCAACQRMVTTIVINEGIGSYEYWGVCETHDDWVEVCPDCESEELLDSEPEEEQDDDQDDTDGDPPAS